MFFGFFFVMPDSPQHYTPLVGIGKREGQTSDLGFRKWTDGGVNGTRLNGWVHVLDPVGGRPSV